MIMAVLIIFPVILQTVINLRMLSIGGQGAMVWKAISAWSGAEPNSKHTSGHGKAPRTLVAGKNFAHTCIYICSNPFRTVHL